MKISNQRAVSSKQWKTILFLLFLLTAHGLRLSAVWADEPIVKNDVAKNDTSTMSPMLEAVDIPTADVLDPKTFSTSFRFYSEGGITSRLVLGPFKRLNV